MIEQVPMSSLVVLVGFLSGFLLALGYFMQLRYAVDNLIRRGFSPSLVFGALLRILRHTCRVRLTHVVEFTCRDFWIGRLFASPRLVHCITRPE